MNRKHLRNPLLAPAFLLVVALLTIAPAAHAAGAVTAALSVTQQGATVGDPVDLVLTVQHPAGYQVLPPKLEQTWGDLTVKAVSPAKTVSNGDGTETTAFQIDVRLFKPGSFVTLPLNVSVTDGSGNLTQVTAAGVPITVVSVLKKGDTALHDIKAQASLPLPVTWPWVLAGILAVLAVAGVVFWLIKRRLARVVDNRLPHERALGELAAIEAMRLPKHGRFKEHYTLVSDCVRNYIERGFGIPALERTTGEIQKDLGAAGFTPEVQAALVAFLEASDIVKFTTLTPDESSAADLLLQARTIVDATKPQAIEPSQPGGKGREQSLPVRSEQALEATI